MRKLPAGINSFIFVAGIFILFSGCSKKNGDKVEPLPVITPTVNPIPYSVVAYLITPPDKTINPDFYRAAKTTLEKLQVWYKTQMGNNKTFILNPVVLDTLTALHNSTWFIQNNGDSISSNNAYYYNTKYELKHLLGLKFDTTLYAYFAFVDADFSNSTIPSGLGVVGSIDLNGLSGSQPDRWVGDAGHALGHAFGFIDALGPSTNDIMSKGWSSYPNCVLTQAEKDSLNAIPFFQAQ